MTADTTGTTEGCDGMAEYPHGSWLLCAATGPHTIHWAYETTSPGCKTARRWTDAALSSVCDCTGAPHCWVVGCPVFTQETP